MQAAALCEDTGAMRRLAGRLGRLLGATTSMLESIGFCAVCVCCGVVKLSAMTSVAIACGSASIFKLGAFSHDGPNRVISVA